jgi:hypothetical protein
MNQNSFTPYLSTPKRESCSKPMKATV